MTRFDLIVLYAAAQYTSELGVDNEALETARVNLHAYLAATQNTGLTTIPTPPPAKK